MYAMYVWMYSGLSIDLTINKRIKNIMEVDWEPKKDAKMNGVN